MDATTYRLGLILGSALAITACGSNSNSIGGNTEPSQGGDASAGGGGQAGGLCKDGDSQLCACPGDAGAPEGQQFCFQNAWLDCNCFGGGDTMPVSVAGACKAGRYEGTFEGFYNSSYTFIGFPIPVTALSATSAPGLAFTLNSTGMAAVTDPNSGADVVTTGNLNISNGYVKGTADGLFPFNAKLIGSLNCDTKKLTATMIGGYCLGVCAGLGINEAQFQGPVVGYYDSASSSFKMGTWDLIEQPPKMGALGKFGGQGSWSAKWVGAGMVDVDSGVTTGP
jgi:hypothetical protein